jgi:MoaA/NifB/PqqE/SkfB family radical SAM enzyme
MGLMSLSDFAKVVDYLAYAEIAYLFGIGEPFLHPGLFDFIKMARPTGVKLSTNTHGMSLKPHICEKILDSGLDEIAISFDGATSETFEFLRAGAKFKTVVDNIIKLQEMKRRRGIDLPELQFATVISRHNVREMLGVVKLAKKLGIRRIVFTDMIMVNPENAELSVAKTDLLLENMQRAKEFGNKAGIEILYFYQYPFPWKKDPAPDWKGHGRRLACQDLWRLCIIDRQGGMKSCCYYPGTSGNVFQTPLSDIINNEASRSLRRRLLEGDPPECCINCGMLKELTPETSQQAIAEAEKAFSEACHSGLLSEADIKSLSEQIISHKEKSQRITDA